MKKSIFIIGIIINGLYTIAQVQVAKDVFAFRITDYMLNISDSTKLVQIKLPESIFKISNAQTGLLIPNYANGKEDTARIGWGKCSLIKGDYYYFSIKVMANSRMPEPNDLLYTFFDYPATFKGRFFKLIKQSIYFDRVTKGSFFNFNTAISLNEKTEMQLLDSLVEDIRFTGKEMLRQNDGQDQVINGGIFDQKRLFASMQTITRQYLIDFIDYVIAYPGKYAGNNWKVSETFATWMISKTPVVIKSQEN